MTELAAGVAAGDTPRSAYRVLERRATVVTVAVLLALAGAAWWSTVDQARDMRSMAQGFAHAGVAMPFDMSIGVFMSMWVAMMVAMMFPTIAPIVLLHRMVVRRRGGGDAMTVAFVGGYLVVWAAIGLVPLAGLLAFRELTEASAWVDRAGGVVLVLAGAYQFTRWKEACQRACRSPLTFLSTHDFGSGPAGTLRAGVTHGLYCFGCCWALMAVLFVVGLMNLAWMAVITAVFIAEKNWRHGPELAKVVGTAVLVLGVAIVAHPALLGDLTPAPAADMGDMMPMGG